MKSDDNSIVSMMREDAARPPSEDRLVKIRTKIAELRDLEVQSASTQERLTELNTKINNMKFRELVDVFDEAGVTKLAIGAEGNLPPYEIEIKPFYKANINSLPPEEQPKAFAWLQKHKAGDLIKSTYTVSFGMGDDKRRKAFVALLKKGKFQYDFEFGVQWNTLTAFVKEQVKAKKDIPLKTLGATVGRMASLVKPKKESTGPSKRSTKRET
jgi:hypothetical protein